jgi:hypothetical protein
MRKVIIGSICVLIFGQIVTNSCTEAEVKNTSTPPVCYDIPSIINNFKHFDNYCLSPL